MTVKRRRRHRRHTNDSRRSADCSRQNIKDVYFDYDSYDDSCRVAVRHHRVTPQFLQQHPNIRFTIEGHCDERGSTEYNLALGDNRANAAKQALTSAGVTANRIRTISYGKEKPSAPNTETCC